MDKVERPKANSIIIRGIEEGLDKIGESGAAATLYFISNKSGLQLNDFPEHPDEFCSALRGIFGTGSSVLLRSIMTLMARAESDLDTAERKKVAIFLRSIEESVKSIESGTI